MWVILVLLLDTRPRIEKRKHKRLLLLSVSLSCVRLFVTRGNAARQAPLSSLPSGICPNSCPLSWWCYLTISSSATPCSFCLQSFPAFRVFSSESALHISCYSFWYFQKTNPHQSSLPIKGCSWTKTRWRRSPLCNSLPLTRRQDPQNWSIESPESPSWATWNTQHHQVNPSSLTSSDQSWDLVSAGGSHIMWTRSLRTCLY